MVIPRITLSKLFPLAGESSYQTLKQRYIALDWGFTERLSPWLYSLAGPTANATGNQRIGRLRGSGGFFSRSLVDRITSVFDARKYTGSTFRKTRTFLGLKKTTIYPGRTEPISLTLPKLTTFLTQFCNIEGVMLGGES